jgi:hypothetical protein
LAADRAANAIQSEGKGAKFSQAEVKHRRGHFPAIAVGISSGNGQTVPERLKHERHAHMVERLMANPSIIRLATFASGTLLTTSMRSSSNMV